MKRLLKVVLWLLVLVILLAAFAPTILSTRFGRWLAEDALGRRLHREVHIGRLDVGWFSGAVVGDVEVKEREGFGDTPFLRIGEIRFPNSMMSLLRSEATLNELTVKGIDVSVVRLADGRLSVDDVAEPSEREPRSGKDEPSPDKPQSEPSLPGWKLPVRVEDVSVTYADKRHGTAVTLEKVELKATYDNGRIDVTDGKGVLNEGQLLFNAHADLRPETFALNVALADVKASSTLSGLAGYLVPILYNPGGAVSGLMYLDLELKGEGFDAASLKTNLTGTSHLEVRDVRIMGSPMLRSMLAAVGGLLGLKHDALTFGSLTAESRIADGRVTTDPIRASHDDDVIVTMAGTTDFDGRIDYRVAFEGKKVDKYLGKWKELFAFRLTGTLSRPVLGLPGLERGLIEGIEGLFK